MILSCLFIDDTADKGRGVFTTEKIPAGTIVEIAPVIVMSKQDRMPIDETLLRDYIFEWGHENNECCIALGYVSIYNHSYQSNCEYEMDYDKELISIKTMKLIHAREELCINYNGTWNNKKPVWFDVRE
jgi:SET domain-containing protein